MIRQSINLLEELALLEAREETLRTKFLPRLLSMLPPIENTSGWWERDRQALRQTIYSREEAANLLFNFLLSIDPDRTKSFSTWIITNYLRGDFRLEDAEQLTNALQIYGDAVTRKKLPVEFRDINKFKSVQELEQVVKQFRQEYKEAQNAQYEAEMLKQSQVIMDSERYRILIPKTELSAQWFGRNTEWCTAWGGKYGRWPNRTSQWRNYQTDPLYIITDKLAGNMWQFHFGTKQFMDISDRPVRMDTFEQDHQEVVDFFARREKASWNLVGKVNGYDAFWKDTVWKGDGHKVSTRVFVVRPKWSSLIQPYHELGYDLFKATSREKKLLTTLYEANAKLDLAELASALTKSGIMGNVDSLVKLGVAWDTKRKAYVEFSKEQAIDKTRNGLIWRKTENAANSNVVYALFDKNEKQKVSFIVSGEMLKVANVGTSRILSNRPDERKNKWTDDVQESIMELLMKFANNRLIELDYDSDIIIRLTPERAKTLSKARPDWFTPRDWYGVIGDTPKMRKRIETIMERDGLNSYGWHKNSLKVQKFDSAQDLIEKYGNDEAKGLIPHVFEGDVVDVGEIRPDIDNMKDLLSELYKRDKVLYKALVKYMTDKYADEIEENNFDIMEPNDLASLQEEIDDDGLDRCFSTGMRWGEESGSQQEMFAAIEKAVSRNPYVWFERDGKMSKDFLYDTPCYLAIPIEDVVRVLSRDDSIYTVTYDGWLDALGEKIYVENAQYGYHGFDDDSALEGFVHELHDLLP